jgi:ferredoxin
MLDSHLVWQVGEAVGHGQDSGPRCTWGCSSVGRARAWHARGQGFDHPQLHSFPGAASTRWVCVRGSSQDRRRLSNFDHMKVWIDQDLCTGDGLCAEIAPDVFAMHDDGLAYVKEADWPNLMGPDGAGDGSPRYKMGEGLAEIPDRIVDDVIEAADECPGECIFIEVA